MKGRNFDAVVIGGGLVGGAIAFGLCRQGLTTAVLDEGDLAFRASRGNFGLVWVQGKGAGMGAYARWTLESARHWPALAGQLQEMTAIDVAYRQPGGFDIALSDAELEQRRATLAQLRELPEIGEYPYEILDHAALARRLPQIGPAVAGASYSPLDGHANPLRLLYALHAGFQQLGGCYLPGNGVERIEPRDDGFAIHCASGERIEAARTILAAGLGSRHLAPMLGLSAPVRPQRGQIIATERTPPFLPYPTSTVRQTEEGSVLIGDSQDESGPEESVAPGMLAVMAERAVRSFPCLSRLRVVRTWAALRVMSPDGFPLYTQSESFPGAFLATCHSGVTLAAVHAEVLAPAIARNCLPKLVAPFNAERFDVHQVA